MDFTPYDERAALRRALRSISMLMAALLLADCDQQAQKTSSNAVKSDAGGAAAERKATAQGARIVINPQFDEADSFSEGLAAIRAGAKYGYIDKQGTIVIKPQFDFAGLFSEGLAGVGIGSKVGYIDKQGNFVITPPFAIANLFSFSEGLAAVRVGEFLTGKWGYIDKQGKVVIKPQFDSVGPFSDGLAVAGVDDKWRYIDQQGQFVIKPQFTSAGSFSDG